MPTLAEILGGIDSVVKPAKKRMIDGLTNPLTYTDPPDPNVWKANFMRATGQNPDAVGATEQDWMRMQQPGLRHSTRGTRG